MVVTASGFPDEWLQVELEVPSSTRNGAPVVAVVASDGATAALPGVVAMEPAASDFGTFSALVAFAPEDAVSVAAALTAGDVSVLLGR